MSNVSQTLTQAQTRPIQLVLFWAYVLIPLVWGVSNTLIQAMKLFS